ncbi:MAG: YggS family pyridoxal phosphate-dependent enzyme [Candidatus Diapherotrites archaeon]|nr:YggS family pyridoxal phosphate-dependent enzyme [Candidatus Diapherotrites archaeon]
MSEISMGQLNGNLASARAKIKVAARMVHKNLDEIKLLLATKNQPSEVLNQLLLLGENIIGENVLQESEEKFKHINNLQNFEKHFIGHLQSNKIRRSVQLFDVIESVDSLEVAEKVSEESLRIGKVMQVFVQVNIGRERQKHGLLSETVGKFLLQISKLKGIKIQGLMCVHPLCENDEVRHYFREMKSLFDELQMKEIPGIDLRFLSMGMSKDFDIAIEEGANFVRVGSAVFGGRN